MNENLKNDENKTQTNGYEGLVWIKFLLLIQMNIIYN